MLFSRKQKDPKKEKEFEIVDMIEELEWNPVKRWSKRSVGSIDRVIIHHTGSKGDVTSINKYHISPGNHISSLGTPHICYHYVISGPFTSNHCDGEIVLVNDIRDITWHCRGQNSRSIGIAVVGNFVDDTKPSSEQLLAVRWLMKHIHEDLGIDKKEFYGHCDFRKPACPGKSLYNEIMLFKNNTI